MGCSSGGSISRARKVSPAASGILGVGIWVANWDCGKITVSWTLYERRWWRLVEGMMCDVRGCRMPLQNLPFGGLTLIIRRNSMAMTINYGVLLGFVPSNDSEHTFFLFQVLLQSGHFEGVHIDSESMICKKPIDNPENINWESYARGAVYALQNSGYDLRKVGIAYLLALENVNDLVISSVDNIQLDK
ncbi:hypothetical protein HU200_063399 [Digitaria exilis]|uniref:Uncharacterized protein n=1 Tax=Digitaria exilis TaxID=1010633 RepID=A0A835ADP5_9POAL|nr:hypothetical protein HU200_063399 [Digitaria exilis]